MANPRCAHGAQIPELYTREMFDTSQVNPKINVSSFSSHMEMQCKFNTKNIAKYISLDPTLKRGIACVTRGMLRRSLIVKKKKKPTSCAFQNSIDVDVMLYGDRPKPTRVNVKIFSNEKGTVQLSGCKECRDGNEAIHRLITELDRPHYVWKDGKMELVSMYVGEIRPIGVTIDMINTDLRLDMKIDRDKLFDHLINSGIKCKLDKCSHDSVDISYYIEGKDKPIAIFVFESGAILITGSKNHHQLGQAYNFLMEIIDPIKEMIREVGADTINKVTSMGKYQDLLMAPPTK